MHIYITEQKFVDTIHNGWWECDIEHRMANPQLWILYWINKLIRFALSKVGVIRNSLIRERTVQMCTFTINPNTAISARGIFICICFGKSFEYFWLDKLTHKLTPTGKQIQQIRIYLSQDKPKNRPINSAGIDLITFMPYGSQNFRRKKVIHPFALFLSFTVNYSY